MVGQLAGRRIIVTGAAGGIGAGTVEVCANAGARVAATWRSTPPPPQLADAASWWQCDLRDEDAVNDVFARATEVLGGLDVLLHCAGNLGALGAWLGHNRRPGLRVRHQPAGDRVHQSGGVRLALRWRRGDREHRLERRSLRQPSFGCLSRGQGGRACVDAGSGACLGSAGSDGQRGAAGRGNARNGSPP
jgi:hypothetical protein